MTVRKEPMGAGSWFWYGSYGPQRRRHRLYVPGMQFVREEPWRRLALLDGVLTPQHDLRSYRPALSRLGGWGYSALAFWDSTAEDIVGAHSIIFAPGLTVMPDQMLAGFQERFPEVSRRMPKIDVQSAAA